jgi:hypothetical protein
MKPSIIVWDLETVPDLAGFAAANDLVGKSGMEVREAIGARISEASLRGRGIGLAELLEQLGLLLRRHADASIGRKITIHC